MIALAATILFSTLGSAKPMLLSKTFAQAPSPDYAAVSKQISDFWTQSSAKTVDGKSPTRKEVQAQVAVFAKGVLKGIDPKTIKADEAQKWADLFVQAEMQEPAEFLQRQAIQYHNVQIMFASSNLIRSFVQQGKDDQAYYLIKHTADFDASMLGMVGEVFTNAAHEAKYDQIKPQYVEKCLKALQGKIDLSPSPMNDRGNSMADYVYVDLGMKILEMQYTNSPKPAILDQMKALKAKFAMSKSTNAFGQSPSHRVDEYFDRVMAVGAAAPPITFQKSIGSFSGLASLKGKVVILDFMAHWCGPCKAALPSIRAWQEQYGAKGLQVVSVTSFYGYYEQKQKISQSSEFEFMHDFVKKFAIAWPVIFDEKQETHSKYHVGAIPHMVLIDQKGVVRMVQVGHTEEGEAKMADLLKKLLSAN